MLPNVPIIWACQMAAVRSWKISVGTMLEAFLLMAKPEGIRFGALMLQLNL